VKQLLQAARQSLEERQPAKCLTLANEVLALVPDQSEAVALSLEAKRREREEIERHAAVEERYEAAREELAAGDLQGAIAALTALLEEEPDHARARQLLDETRAQSSEEDAGTRRLIENASDGPKADTLLQRVPEVRDDVTVFERPVLPELAKSRELSAAIEPFVPGGGVEAGPVEAASPATEPSVARQSASPSGAGQLLRFRRRYLVLSVSGLLIVVCAIFFWVASSRRLPSEVDRGRKLVSLAREEAVKVDANRLASSLFEEAAAKDRAGEQQAKDGRLGAAVETMRGAAVRYEEAGRAARAIGVDRAKADRARALMLAAKERAAREIPAFQEGLARESEGDSRYEKLAFQDAAERFEAATRLFATAPPPAPAPPVIVPATSGRPAAPDSASEIREMLHLYSRVFESKDLALLQQVRPGIRPEELSRYRDVFDRTRSYKLNLKVDSIKVDADEAEARGRREDVVVTSNGETVRTPGEFRFRFKRSNNRWTIDAVR